MEKIVRVNMDDLTVEVEPVPKEYQGLGGRGLTSTIVASEVPPKCDPLGPENKLVIASGLLNNTSAPNAGRLSVGCKSPLTGTIKEANAGGVVGTKFGRMGIAAVIVSGKPKKKGLYKLVLTKDGGKLEPADELKGLGNYDTVAKLTEEYGEKMGYISIGQAGEMLLKGSSIAVNDRDNRPTRHAGRGGVGAVMGSKGLKTIVVDDTGGRLPKAVDPEGFKKASKKLLDALKTHSVTSEGLPTFGTNILANIVNEAGGYPTRNFSEGRFEGVEKISGETQHDLILERGGKIKHGCMPGCVIQCSRSYHDKDGNFLTKGPEYETIWANGANCGIDDLDAIAQIDRLCDDYGLDTIEWGDAMAVAMEGGVLEFGDAKGAIKLLKEVPKGTELAMILGNGVVATGKAYNVSRVPAVKGQGLPAYDPRPIMGIGVTYATSTMGGDHTAGYAIAPNVLKVGGEVDPLKPEGQVDTSRNLQIATAAVDTAGLCLFIAFAVLDIPSGFEGVYEMLNAQYGLNLTADDVGALGMKILKIEREFNKKAGFTSADDRLPDFFYKEKLAPHNKVFEVTDKELDQVYNF
ncbi:MAG: aldehyde ferredoxin oxidoreductase [Deltaproteobacteria bacterium]|uniref:Aldehyde ferredoxin oxidoreductase n=1 Tax=Candidatus Zymogenus saltonus TaxID=2844893 RepID=A0A9D8PNU2_9DELT|nr:aldehyde ferredoxin oxidoreductase [Candidatus Zymogenus saltonus]